MSRLAAVITAALLALLLPLPRPALAAAPAPSASPLCPATDTSSQCEQKRALDKVRGQLNSSLETAQSAQTQLAESIAANQRQQSLLQARVEAAQARVADLDAEIERDAAESARLAQEIAREQRQVRVLARAIYLEPTSLLMVFATARDLTDALAGTADVFAAGSRAAAIERRIAEQKDRVAAEEAAAEKARMDQVKIRDQVQADLAKLVALRQDQAQKSVQLAASMARTRAELAALDHQEADLAQQIAQRLKDEQERIIAEAMQQAWAQALLWASANPGTPGISPGHSQKYRFIWPEPSSVVTQIFGPCDLDLEPPYAGFAHFHTGIDMAEPEGSQVLAADDGVVAAVGDGQTGYGRYVVLLHRDGLMTLYGHLAQPVVKLGDNVIQGQPVGLEGSTGNSTGPHLHFELRIGGQPRDPAPLLPPGPPSAFRG